MHIVIVGVYYDVWHYVLCTIKGSTININFVDGLCIYECNFHLQAQSGFQLLCMAIRPILPQTFMINCPDTIFILKDLG